MYYLAGLKGASFARDGSFRGLDGMLVFPLGIRGFGLRKACLLSALVGVDVFCFCCTVLSLVRQLFSFVAFGYFARHRHHRAAGAGERLSRFHPSIFGSRS